MSRAEELFDKALSMSPAERESFLEKACGADFILRQDVESLLQHAEDAPRSFLEGRAVELESFGPYRVEERIGHGGQGSVYRAIDTRFDRKVALKVLNPAMALSEDALARFQREAEATARLDHAGICAVYETGQVEGAPYIAMQYIEGRTLQDVIEATREDPDWTKPSVRLPGAEDSAPQASSSISGKSHARRSPGMRVVSLIEQVARALDVAHRAGVIHRDIKPGNIIVTDDGRPVVLDFGLARDLQGDGPTLTRAGDIFGTPHYMSPEQITRSAIRLDRRTDVYSLGCVLYQCLTLTVPFDADGVEELYHAILTREPTNPRKIHPAIPGDVRVILETAMDKDRDRRYATAADFADDLKAVLEYRPIRAKPISPVGRAIRWVQREPMKAALLAVLAIGLPVLTWLGGNVAAHQLAIDVGRAAERKRQEHHHYDQGMTLLSTNDYEAGKPHFEKCLDLNPRSVRGLMGLWWIELDRKRGLKVLETHLDELAGDTSYDALLAVARWSAYPEEKDRDEKYLAPLKQRPNWLAYFFGGGADWLMGVGMSRRDLLERAAAQLELSELTGSGSLLGGLVKIAECHAGTGDPRFGVIERVIKDLYPSEAQGWAYLSKCKAWQGELAEAHALRDHAARLIDEGDDSRSAYLLRLDAVIANAEGRFDDAVEVGRRAYKKRRNHYTGLTLAYACFGAGRFDDARSVLADVSTIGEGGFGAGPLLALCDAREGKHDDALDLLTGISAKAEAADEPMTLKAQILLDLGRTEEAEAAVAEAMKRWEHRLWSRYLYARVLLAKDDEAAARRAFDDVVADDPGFTQRRSYDDNLSHEAVRCALQVGARLYPDQAARHHEFARFLLDPKTRQHNVAGALEPARRAAELDETYRLTLAEALFANGKKAEAVALAEEIGDADATAALARFRAAR